MNKLNLIIPLMFTIMMLMVMMITWINFQPTHLIMMSIMYSVLISMNLSLLKKNFMFFIMLFLIMISEVLIIFLYFFSSLMISDEKISSMTPKKLTYNSITTNAVSIYYMKI